MTIEEQKFSEINQLLSQIRGRYFFKRLRNLVLLVLSYLAYLLTAVCVMFVVGMFFGFPTFGNADGCFLYCNDKQVQAMNELNRWLQLAILIASIAFFFLAISLKSLYRNRQTLDSIWKIVNSDNYVNQSTNDAQ